MKDSLFNAMEAEFGLNSPVHLTSHSFDSHLFAKFFRDGFYEDSIEEGESAEEAAEYADYLAYTVLSSEVSTYQFSNGVKIKAYIATFDDNGSGYAIAAINSSEPIIEGQSNGQLVFLSYGNEDGFEAELHDPSAPDYDHWDADFYQLVNPIIGGEI